MPYLTPDTAPGSTRCRVLIIPDDKEWLALVTGALSELTHAYNFEEFGTATPEETAQAFRDMLALYVDCEPTMPDFIKLTDTKAANNAGGTFTSGAWRTRDLTTEDLDTGNHCTLTSNQFTLQPGTYDIDVQAPAYLVSAHQARLWNVTDSVEVARSTTPYTGAGVLNYAVLQHRFTIATTKTFRIEHRGDNTTGTYGFGVNNSWGDPNIYTQVILKRWE